MESYEFSEDHYLERLKKQFENSKFRIIDTHFLQELPEESEIPPWSFFKKIFYKIIKSPVNMNHEFSFHDLIVMPNGEVRIVSRYNFTEERDLVDYVDLKDKNYMINAAESCVKTYYLKFTIPLDTRCIEIL